MDFLLVFKGTWLGALSAFASLARAVGPFLVGWIYDDYGTYWTFGTQFICGGLALTLLIINYKRLIPYHAHNDQEDDNFEVEVTKF